MEPDLLAPLGQLGADRHDSGSKVRMPLLPGVHGSAMFLGDRREHRILLERWWGPKTDDTPFALWIGMNPSAAGDDRDDLTARKEQWWTRNSLKLSSYVKMNFGTYVATRPADLANVRTTLTHPSNLDTMRRYALQADQVIITSGRPPEVLLKSYFDHLDALQVEGVPMLCLGRTNGGWPKHSSRLAYATQFEEFRP